MDFNQCARSINPMTTATATAIVAQIIVFPVIATPANKELDA
jgi:hypothetical protein